MKKALSIIMIFLICSLTVTPALADSGMLEDVKYSGEDNVQSILRSHDTLDISVKAKLLDLDNNPLPVTQDNLKLAIDGSSDIPFSSCSNTSGGSYNCSYQLAARDFETRPYSIAIKLYDSSGFRVAGHSGSVFVDASPPAFSSITIPSGIGNNNMQIPFSAYDTACDSCQANCIGLARLELKLRNSTVYQTNLSGCSHSGQIEVSAASMNLEEGSNDVCVELYDRGGLRSVSCHSIFADFNAPVISLDTAELYDDSGIRINYPTDEPLSLVLDISESTGLSSAVAGSVQGECEQEDSVYSCRFEHIMLDDGSITVFAYDDAGNNASQEIEFNFEEDDDPPVVESISTERGEFLRQAGNTFIAEIEESGSGMYRADAYLRLSELNPSYGQARQADRCEAQEGVWKCFWDDIRAQDAQSGHMYSVQMVLLKDDAGNAFDSSAGSVSFEMMYDDVPPVFVNGSIRPLGTSLDILRVGDIVEIIAIIADNHSGVAPESVQADFSDINRDLNWTDADSCSELNDSFYECRWEYSQALTEGRINLDFDITDNAGNNIRKNNGASSFVAEVSEREVDFWQEKAVATSAGRLNPNFLWMSSDGTLINAMVKLASKSGQPYVHDFTITGCVGELMGPDVGNASETREYPIFSQIQGASAAEKILVINIPNHDKSLVGNATGTEITCVGEVLQARSRTGDIYSPNEAVNATIKIKFLTGVFNDPAVNTVNKIDKNRMDMDAMDDVIDALDTITGFLQPICQAINTIRSLINSLCTILSGITTLWGGVVPNECPLNAIPIEKIWKGTSVPVWGSTKSLISLGFWCDLVLCEECSKIWNGFLVEGTPLGQGVDFIKTDAMRNNPVFDVSINFNPFENVIVATVCMPPCLIGIQSFLVKYKQIQVHYNVCLNIASIRGEGSGQCEEFKSAQTCRLIVTNVLPWSIFEEFLKRYIVSLALSWGMDMLHKTTCDGLALSEAGGAKNAYVGCAMDKIVEVLGWIIELDNTYQQIRSLGDLKQAFQDEHNVKTEIEDELAEGEDGFGEFPDYGGMK